MKSHDTPLGPSPRRPLLTLAETLVFPGAVASVEVEDDGNRRALDSLNGGETLCLATPEEPGVEPSQPRDLATLVRTVSRFRLGDGRSRVVLQGLRRVRLADLRRQDGVLSAVPVELEAPCNGVRDEEVDRLIAGLAAVADDDPRFPRELAALIAANRERPAHVTDLAAAVLPLEDETRRALWAEPDPRQRFGILNRALEEELVRIRTEHELEGEVARRIRRQYLREKLAAVRAELDEPDPHAADAAGLEEPIESAHLSDAARAALLRELALYRRAAPNSPEAARLRNHMQWVLELPWRAPGTRPRAERLETVVAKLNESHVGREDVKQRIGEFLAVRQLGGGGRGTVLCFHGPPGTGKSSMGRALAQALHRDILIISVGTMSQEWEISGVSHKHKSGAPGAILAGLHRCGSDDPVVLLDEIDRLRLGVEGNSSGALMQLLDPEHNGEFFDHYLGAPFDLSNCLFLATATDPDEIPPALLDRMETIEFSGYTESEKLAIARRHLAPRALQQAGLERGQLKLTPAALRTVLEGYTSEEGVRQFQRVLTSLARKAAVNLVTHGEGLKVKKADLRGLLGPPTAERELRMRRPVVGVATGLAWTTVGGALLPIEALAMPGSGELTLTGQVGDTLRESVQTAISYLRTRLKSLGLAREMLGQLDLHLHFPSGDTPKDGPSAGVAILTALVSLLLGRPVRHDLALTGEVSLLGAVLPVGGLREKCLAAIRTGIPEVVVPARNADDVQRLPSEIRERLVLHAVENVDEAFELALLEPTRDSAAPRLSPSRRSQVA